MRKAITLSALFCASVFGVSQVHQAKHTALFEDLQVGPTDPMYYVQGIRGLYNGIEDGLHKTKSQKDICLNDETQQNLIHIIETLINQDFSNIKDLLPDAMEIVENLKKCATSKDTIYSFCMEDMNRCTPMTLQQNVQKNLFVIMSKVTDLQKLVKDFPAADSEELYQQTYQAGTDVGSIVKVVFNYKDSTTVAKKNF